MGIANKPIEKMTRPRKGKHGSGDKADENLATSPLEERHKVTPPLVKKYCVLILGMHRSGTSALSRHILDKGFSLTSEPFPPHPDDNPLGYWESRELALLNNDFMNEIGIDWKDVNPLPGDCFSSEIATSYRKRIKALLQSAFQSDSQIVIKDPRMCRLLPLWLPVLVEQCHHLATIFIVRQADSVFRSLARRWESSDIKPGAIVERNHAIALWLRYNVEAEFNSRELTRMTLGFEQWLEDPSQITARIDSFLHESLPGAKLNPATPDLRKVRYVFETKGSDHVEIDSLCRQTYEVLCGKSGAGFLANLQKNTACRFPTTLQDEVSPPSSEIVAQAILKHVSGRTPVSLSARNAGSQVRELSTKRIIFISDLVENPSHIYRVKNMVDAINANEGLAFWTTSEQAVRELSHLQGARLVIIHRCLWSENIKTIFRYCENNEITTAYDIDDLIFESRFIELGYIHFISQLSLQDREFWENKIKGFRQTLDSANFCITSTPAIQDHLIGLNKSAVCIPNGFTDENIIIADHWREKRRTEKASFCLGYASGSPTHAGDFAQIVKPVAKFLARHENWKLIIVGTLDFSPYADVFNEEQIELRPKVELTNLAYELARFDINLIPLEQNPFCDAKSPLKWYEAALCGVPSIATGNLMYTRIFRNGDSGLLASSGDDWLVQLECLASDQSLRSQLAERARTQIVKYSPGNISARFEMLH